MGIKHFYDEIFNIEVDGWVYALQNYPGEVSEGLVHQFIKQLGPFFDHAVKYGYAFNVPEVSTKLSKAARYLVAEKDIATSIAFRLPSPKDRSEEEQVTIAAIIDELEKAYGGLLAKLEEKWAVEAKRKIAA